MTVHILKNMFEGNMSQRLQSETTTAKLATDWKGHRRNSNEPRRPHPKTATKRKTHKTKRPKSKAASNQTRQAETPPTKTAKHRNGPKPENNNPDWPQPPAYRRYDTTPPFLVC